MATAAPTITRRKFAKGSYQESRDKTERRLGIVLTAPVVIVLLAVAGYPILNAAWLSLFDYRFTAPGEREFVGLQNYGVILSDSLWWRDVWTTVEITLITVTAEMLLGFVFAFVMYKVVFGRSVIRTSILIPYAVITVVSAYAWKYAFAPDSGFINTWFDITKDWFGARGSSLFVICSSEIWKTTPFVSLLLLAGLSQVPQHLQQAAMVDGANSWQRFTRVILPNMQGAIMVALLFRTIDAFRVFDNIFIMTQGAEGTESVSILAYRQTVSRAEIGLGSAVSILLFLTVMLLCVVFIKVLRTPVGKVKGE